MTVGYLALAHDYASTALTGFLVIFENLAIITYLSDLINIGDAVASDRAQFIPAGKVVEKHIMDN